MEFRFQYLNPQGEWEDQGVAAGSGEEAVLEAIDGLIAQNGGTLAVGQYRYLPVDEGDLLQWGTFELTPTGAVISPAN